MRDPTLLVALGALAVNGFLAVCAWMSIRAARDAAFASRESADAQLRVQVLQALATGDSVCYDAYIDALSEEKEKFDLGWGLFEVLQNANVSDTLVTKMLKFAEQLIVHYGETNVTSVLDPVTVGQRDAFANIRLKFRYAQAAWSGLLIECIHHCPALRKQVHLFAKSIHPDLVRAVLLYETSEERKLPLDQFSSTRTATAMLSLLQMWTPELEYIHEQVRNAPPL